MNFQRYCYYYFQKTTFPTEKRRALCKIIAFLCFLDWRTKVTSNEHFLSILRKSKTLYVWGFWSSDNFFEKRLPALKVVYYRDYKNFFNDLFRNDILQAQALTDTKENVQTTIVNIFNEHAPPQKRRYVRANQAPFMNKKLSKEIMTRSRLRNKFLKTKTDANRKAYNKQRNYCVSLFRREKKSLFNNPITKKIVDNKRFWQTVKPFFSDKNNKITLIEDKTKIVSGNDIVGESSTIFLQLLSHR